MGFIVTSGFMGLLILSLNPAPTRLTPQAVTCDPNPQFQSLADGWRFSPDTADIGRDAGWYRADFDDSTWRDDLPTGVAWETVLGDYDGVGWYRTQVTLPNWDAVWFAVSGLDDIGEFWIDGTSVHVWETISDRATFFNLRDYGTPNQTLTLAFRVVDLGVYGGLKETLRIGAEHYLATTSELYMKWLADNNPTWQLPSWTRGGKLAWTMTGGLNQSDETLVSMDGAIAPWARAPIMQLWVYQPQSQTFLPLNMDFRLVEGHLPIIQWSGANDGFIVDATVVHHAPSDSVQVHFRIVNNTVTSQNNYQILISVLPFAVNKNDSPIHALFARDRKHLWVNNAPFMVAQTPPDAVGVGRVADVMNGQIPNAVALDCIPSGDGAALLAYSINHEQVKELRFALPTSPDAPAFPSIDTSFEQMLEQTASLWREQLGRITMNLPDTRVQAAAHASLGYLLIATDPNGVHPGPLAHNAVWVRDTAYIGLALLQAGHADTVKNFIPSIFDAQEADGRIPPIQGEDAPWLDDEWDSQGQAIFLVTTYHRYTGDTELLRAYYPQLLLAAEFLRDLRAGYMPENPSARGLLPPSLSAEDLGPKDQHYYWDNLWAIIGLRELAQVADLLGEDDADWLIAEADAINQAIHDSVASLLGENPPYLPVSVEELGTPAMARGGVPMVYPSNAFQADDDFIQRSFEYYYDQWIKPHRGGFVHREGQWWVYGGTELAHGFLRVGMGGALHDVLGWALSNQTLDGVYAWAEQVSPAGLGFTGGDMPHAWAAASIFTLARHMVVWEDGDTMRLFTHAPEWWFSDAREVLIERLPTHFGRLRLHTTNDIQVTDGGWRGTLRLSYALDGTIPAGGMVWHLHHMPASFTATHEATIENGMLLLFANADEIVLQFGD